MTDVADFYGAVALGGDVDFTGATFESTQPFRIEPTEGLSITGGTFKSLSTTLRDRPTIVVAGGVDVWLDKVTVDGGYPLGGVGHYDKRFEGQHGIAVYGTRGVQVTGCTVRNTRGDLLHLARGEDVPGNDRPWTTNVTAVGNMFVNGARHGLCTQGVDELAFGLNIVHNTGHATWDAEPSFDNGADVGNDTTNVSFTDNWAGTSGLLFVAAAGHGDVSHVTVARNHIFGDSLDILIQDEAGGRRRDWNVTDNVADKSMGNPNRGAVIAYRVDGLTVTGNVQPMNKGRTMYAAVAHDCTGITVSGNQLGPWATGQKLVLAT